jgi:cell division septum initiation protein DivIVA
MVFKITELEVLQEENSKLKEEIKLLKMDDKNRNNYMIKAFTTLTNSGGRKAMVSKLNKEKIDTIANSLNPISSITLKQLTKEDLMLILLYREANLFRIAYEYEESLKNQDREIFQNLRKEIERYERMLLNDNLLYKELNIANKQFLDLSNDYKQLRLKNYDMGGKIIQLNENLKNHKSIDEIKDNINKNLNYYQNILKIDNLTCKVLKEFCDDLIKRLEE